MPIRQHAWHPILESSRSKNVAYPTHLSHTASKCSFSHRARLCLQPTEVVGPSKYCCKNTIRVTKNTSLRKPCQRLPIQNGKTSVRRRRTCNGVAIPRMRAIASGCSSKLSTCDLSDLFLQLGLQYDWIYIVTPLSSFARSRSHIPV